MKPTFRRIGNKRGIYMPLFWLDTHPKYLSWGEESLMRIAPAADVVLVVSDNTLKEPPRGTTDWIVLETDPAMWDYFRAAVALFKRKRVGAFFYVGADDLHSLEGAQAMLDTCMNKCDVAYTDYKVIDHRGLVFPAKPDFTFHFTDPEHPPFEAQQYPETSAFRTSIFTEFPPEDTRKFIASSMRQAMNAGKMPTGKKVPEAVFGYMQHGQHQYDRSFQND